MEALSPPPAGIATQPDAPTPAPVPQERKGGLARAFLAVAIAIVFLTGAVAAFYTGSLQPEKRTSNGQPPVGTVPYPTAWVSLNTSHGEIIIGLYGNETPVTAGNFINLTKSGFYTGTIFHRIVPGFVIQGGGYTPEMVAKPAPYPPIKLEINNKLHNVRGTVAMARTSDPDSATTQFFINLVDNSPGKLDPGGYSQDGYAVFGMVVKGMDAVDRIAAVQTEYPPGNAQEKSQPTQDEIPGLMISNAIITRNPG
jgi:peptidyl-prolyl cis-trans isomerase A (cyclophilin A)